VEGQSRLACTFPPLESDSRHHLVIFYLSLDVVLQLHSIAIRKSWGFSAFARESWLLCEHYSTNHVQGEDNQTRGIFDERQTPRFNGKTKKTIENVTENTKRNRLTSAATRHDHYPYRIKPHSTWLCQLSFDATAKRPRSHFCREMEGRTDGRPENRETQRAQCTVSHVLAHDCLAAAGINVESVGETGELPAGM
jgi:hypothetical protein